MKITHPHTGINIRFRRWSRKAYAVFASLGKSISIGNLSVDMAGETLFRKVEQIKEILSGEPEKECNAEEELSVLLSESSVMVTFVNKPSGEYPAAINTYISFTHTVKMANRLF